MRLLKLTMQAFGPFKDKVVIDFEKDNINSGLLLISGDTGAGKTTIFDAICFALYGEPSGSTREAKSLRSDFASPSEETFVELIFEYKNKNYTVKRNPEYMRMAKKGDKETKQAASASFEKNGIQFSKMGDVTKAIEELIGLNKNQFRQVAMLSQGEFSDFLLADSEEKTKIFRRIYGTENYEKIQNKIKDDAKVAEGKYKSLKERIDTEMNRLNEIIDDSWRTNDDIINGLDAKIEEGKISLEEASNDCKEKDKERDKLVDEINKIKDINKKIADYENAKNGLNQLITDNPNISEIKLNYEYNIKVANKIKHELLTINKIKEDLSDKDKKLAESIKMHEEKNKQFKANEEKYKELDSRISVIEKITKEILELTDSNRKFESLKRLKNELNNVGKAYEVSLKTQKELNDEFSEMKKTYYLNQAFVLANELKDGEKCPVCGSIHHPEKAKAIDHNYTKEELDAKEKAWNKSGSECIRLEEIINNLNKNIAELNIDKDIDLDKAIEDNKSLIKNKEFEKTEKESYYKKLETNKNELESSIRVLENQNKNLRDDIKCKKEQLEKEEKELEQLYSSNNTSYEDYCSKKKTDDELNRIGRMLEEFSSKKSRFEGVINLNEEYVKGKQIVDVSSKEELLQSVKQQYEELSTIYTNLKSKQDELCTTTNNIKNYNVDFSKAEKEFIMLDKLSRTANGNLDERTKLTFETYVQAYYLKDVLKEANKRLDKMTDGNYELRNKVSTNKNKKIGLDFSIFDASTGKERDVSTLSGGEKFKASLALALGLSDNISNKQGGIQIDSLFIDEGFGSLDNSSLNQALIVLNELSNNDKLVGVISHVDVLEDKIENKIVVKKGKTGSSLEVINGK